MIKVAVMGFGNVGKSAIDAALAAKDIELVGVIRREAKALPKAYDDIQVVSDVHDLASKPDVVILALPTRSIPEAAQELLAQGVSTVDSYDIHGNILELKKSCEPIAQEHNVCSIHSAGWDPGSDSIVRALMQALAPRGISYTNFGPGMSMGHTVAVKSKEGVKNAISMTIPLGTGVHRRMVYVELEEGANKERVEKAILSDDYFVNDESHVIFVENVEDYIDMGHGVNLVRKGGVGSTQNQLLEFDMKINNPALTGQVLVASARAAMRMQPGAYTLIEVPVINLLEGDKDELIKHLV